MYENHSFPPTPPNPPPHTPPPLVYSNSFLHWGVCTCLFPLTLFASQRLSVSLPVLEIRFYVLGPVSRLSEALLPCWRQTRDTPRDFPVSSLFLSFHRKFHEAQVNRMYVAGPCCLWSEFRKAAQSLQKQKLLKSFYKFWLTRCFSRMPARMDDRKL